MHNYFDNLSKRFEDNDFFHENLQNYIDNHSLNPDQCATNLFNKLKSEIDFNSDFDEIFVQVTDKDICNNNNCLPTKVLILLYKKLNVLDKLEEETICEYLSSLFEPHANGYIYNNTPAIEVSTIQKNQKIMSEFISDQKLFTIYLT